MKTTLKILFIAVSLTSYSQDREFIGALSENTDKSVYTAMQNMWYGNEKISYIAVLPSIVNQVRPVIPLREGEGINESYLFEANLYAQIPIAMGRNHSKHFWQTSRATFDFGFNIRMAQDESNPLLPNNNVIGFSIDKVVWNSYTDRNTIRGNKLAYAHDNWFDRDEALQNISLTLTAHHYSNGQQAGFFIRDTVNGIPLRRNDYKKGDFSTNYIRLGATYSYLSKTRNLFSANLAYQYDGSIFGPLVYSEEQEKSYGHHRLTSFLQWRILNRLSSRNMAVYDVCADTYNDRSVKRYQELVFRWEGEYIMDSDLSDYISTESKHRFNQHLYIKYTRPNWRAFGFMLHGYYGRDYSNIRYDMPIVAIMGGVSVEFNKYIPSLSRSMKFD